MTLSNTVYSRHIGSNCDCYSSEIKLAYSNLQRCIKHMINPNYKHNSQMLMKVQSKRTIRNVTLLWITWMLQARTVHM